MQGLETKVLAPRVKTQLLDAYSVTRSRSIAMCARLENEDYGLQAEPFTSPPKWHLAHTTWFFETFLLKPYASDYQVFDAHYEVLFNSYYNGVGEQFPRPQRGVLSRPTVSEVIRYREYVDLAMMRLLDQSQHANFADIELRCRLGIEHEKQHQELFFTDLKFCFSRNPLYPVYLELNASSAFDMRFKKSAESNGPATGSDETIQWLDYSGGLISIGVDSSRDSENKNVSFSYDSFSYDNESPRHQVFLKAFSLASKLVTNAEYQAFIDDGGYERSEFWLSDGWSKIQQEQWQAPLYWLDVNGQNMEFTLHGLKPRKADSPVCHVSAFEADAYANWAKARLPTEAEWEHAASQENIDLGNYQAERELEVLHPGSGDSKGTFNQLPKPSLKQLYDNCWQWTSSAYRPYPGFKTAEGAIGEYNGKFMCNQWVLRGGSCVSSEGHLRATYRNFFYPEERWQFSGIRLAKDSSK